MAEIGSSRNRVRWLAMDSPREPDEVEMPPCPICTGKLEVVYYRYHQKVAVCSDCNVGITIPGSSWVIARLKREGNWNNKAS